MNAWKLTSIAFLAGIMATPVLSMNMEGRTEKSTKSNVLSNSSFAHTVSGLENAQDDKAVHEIIEKAMVELHLLEEQIQALLHHYREGEQAAYSERAYDRGFDYTRLYQYQQGYHEHNKLSKSTAAGKFHNAPMNTKIVPIENLLKEIHSLMSLLEQCREVALEHIANKHDKDKQTELMDLIKKVLHQHEQIMNNPIFMEIIEHPGEFELHKEIGSNIFAPHTCPDHLIMGKKVMTLFPHFSLEAWNNASKSRDVRTGVPKEPMTQIRLQGKLWDVFAGTKDQPQRFQGNEVMVFLNEENTSKRCIYKFNHEEGYGYMPPHGWGPQQVSYSILLIPAKIQHPDPRDKSYDEIPEGLEQQVKGERLNPADTTSPHDSRRAVNEEIHQRLARRDFEENRTRRLHRRDIPMEQESEGYLMPSDIKDQTYGRVHVPDYRYGRFYGRRAHDFVPSTSANRDEMLVAQMHRNDWEIAHEHALEGKGTVNK